MEKIEEKLVKVVNEELTEEKLKFEKDVEFIEKIKNDSTCEAEGKKEIADFYKIADEEIVLAISSRFANMYNFEIEDFYDIAQKGYKRGKELYEKSVKNKNVKNDHRIMASIIMCETTILFRDKISKIINDDEENHIYVRDVEMIKKYNDAMSYIRENCEKELMGNEYQRYIVTLLSRPGEEEDNYKMLDKLGILKFNKGKRLERNNKK